MIDAGKDVRRRSTALSKLSDTVQGMMAAWTEDNFGYFEQTMELIREGAPVQWVKLYMEAVKMGIIKESNINININRAQDRENLQALVRTRIPSASMVTSPTPQRPAVMPDAEERQEVKYTPFEEVNSTNHD